MKIYRYALICVCITFFGCYFESEKDVADKIKCYIELSPTGAVYIGLRIENNSKHSITLPYSPAASVGDNIPFIAVTPGNLLNTYDSNNNLVTNSIVNYTFLKEMDEHKSKGITIAPNHTWELPGRGYGVDLKPGTYTMVFICRIKKKSNAGYYFITSQPVGFIIK